VSSFLLLGRQSRGRATLSDRSFGRAEKSPPSRSSAPIKRPPSIRRCGAVTSVRFSTSAIARVVRAGRKKSGGFSILLRSCDRKNGRSAPAESLMRPTKRVARLRATNNSCLYPFPLSSPPSPPLSLSLSRALSFSLPSRLVSSLSFSSPPQTLVPPQRPRCPSSLRRFLSSASFVRRSNSNSCRERNRGIYRGRALAFEVDGSGPAESDRCSDDPGSPCPRAIRSHT